MAAVGCNSDEFFDDDDKAEEVAVVDTGPRERAARGENVRCFESFGKFKRAMAKKGQKSVKGNSEWHHIVGQHRHNVAKFGAYDLHCTDNVILLKHKDHTAVNGYYTERREELGRMSLRDWLKPKDFDEQYKYGLKVLKELNIQWKPTK
jgi:hypothetical protein